MHEPQASAQHPKARRLEEASQIGLPVPSFIVLSALDHLDAAAPTIHAWLQSGPVIVRGALAFEDSEGCSWAGMAQSVAGCRDWAAVVAACQQVQVAADHAQREFGGDLPDQARSCEWIIQREIQRHRLLVVLGTLAHGRVDSYSEQGEVLSIGATPSASSTLAAFLAHDPQRESVAAIIEEVTRRWSWRHGFDLEIIEEQNGKVWLVQARPLVVALPPAGQDFVSAVNAAVQRGELSPIDWHGTLTLDAEHNPEPLSVAHSWLMGELNRLRPAKVGDPQVIAGWLYVQTLVREWKSPPPTVVLAPNQANCSQVEAALLRLHHEFIRDFRHKTSAYRQSLPELERTQWSIALAEAMALFLAMVDIYSEVLVPARRHAGVLALEDQELPATLAERTDYLDVLPASWDLCASPLSTWLPDETSTDSLRADACQSSALAKLEAMPFGPQRDARALALLGEWDDHLFALGLAPVRWFFLRAAEILKWSDEDVFFLSGDELRDAATQELWFDDPQQRAGELARRRQQQVWSATLRPPLKIVDGLALDEPARRHLQGLGLGPSFSGKVALFRDLAELLAAPPPVTSIVCLPALSAQAAWVLARLQIRAVCTEYGAMTSHGALMARELGLSAVIGCRGVMSIAAGSMARLDTRVGRLRVLATYDGVNHSNEQAKLDHSNRVFR